MPKNKPTVSFSFKPVYENEYLIQDMLQQLNTFCNQLVQRDLHGLCPSSVEGTLTIKLQKKDITKDEILDAFNQPSEDDPAVIEEVKQMFRGTSGTKGLQHPNLSWQENLKRIKQDNE